MTTPAEEATADPTTAAGDDVAVVDGWRAWASSPGVWACVVAWIGARVMVLPLSPQGDTALYFEVSDAVLSGAVPWLTQAFEYPPGALLLVLVPHLVASDLETYVAAFGGLALIVDGGMLLGVALLAGRGRPSSTAAAAALLYLATTAPLGAILVQRMDIYVGFAVLMAMASMRVDGRLALGWLVFGAWLKLVTVVLIPLVLLELARRELEERGEPPSALAVLRATLAPPGLRRAGLSAGGLLLLFAPFWVWSDGAILDVVSYHLARGLQIESLPATLVMAASWVAPMELRAEFVFGATHLAGESAALPAALSLSTAGSIAAVVGVCAAVLRRRIHVIDATLAMLALTLASAKVFSPQFLLWLSPLLAWRLATAPAAGRVCASISIAVLTGMVTRYMSLELNAFGGSAVSMLLVRNALVVALGVSMLSGRDVLVSVERVPLRSLELALRVGVAVLIVVVCGYSVTSSDFWLHRKVGLGILAGEGIPTVDTWGAFPGAPWVAHEWLSAVVLALVDDVAGPFGLIALRVTVVAAVIGLSLLMVPRSSRFGLFALIIVVAELFALRAWAHLRPHLIALIPTVVFLLCLDRWRVAFQRRWLVAIVALVPLWANLHGSYLLVPAVLGIFVLVSQFAPFRRDRMVGGVVPLDTLELGVAAAAALAAALCNPRGVDLIRFSLEIFFTRGDIREHIYEWQPTFATFLPAPPFLAYGAIVVAFWALVGSSPRHARSVFVMTWGVVATALSVFAVRFLPLAMLMLGPWVVTLASDRFTLRARTRTVSAFLLGATLFAMVFASFMNRPISGFGYGDNQPKEAVEAIRAAGYTGRIYNEYSDGAYLIHALSPDVRPAIDARIDIYEPTYTRAYFNSRQSPDAFVSFLVEHQLEMALLDRIYANREPVELLQRQGFVIAFQDEHRLLFVRNPPGGEAAGFVPGGGEVGPPP